MAKNGLRVPEIVGRDASEKKHRRKSFGDFFVRL